MISRIALLVVLAFLAASCGQTGDTSVQATPVQTATPEHAADSYFIQQMSTTHYDYVVTDRPSQLAEASTVVLGGMLVDVQDGRMYVFEDAPWANDRRVVLKVAIETSVKTDGLLTPEAEFAYVEIAVGPGLDIDLLRENLPTDFVALFLVETLENEYANSESEGGENTIRVEGQGNGQPADTMLYTPITPQGFLLVREGEQLLSVMGLGTDAWPSDEVVEEDQVFLEGLVPDEFWTDSEPRPSDSDETN